MKRLNILWLILLLAACSKGDTSLINLDTQYPDKLRAIQFLDEDRGFAVGGMRYDNDRLLRTSDAGASWQAADPLQGKSLFDIEIGADGRGYACGLDGQIFRTTDAGQSWAFRQMVYWSPLYAITMASNELIVAVGGEGYDYGLIVRSGDDGGNWARPDTLDYELRDVLFTDPLTGYVCGYSVIMKTTDGALNWELLDVKGEFFSALAFPTTEMGYAVGRTGTIVKTTDAGETWEKQRNGNNIIQNRQCYNDVAFWDTETGYIVGDKGLLLKTTDGGKKWQKQATETDLDLYSISLIAAEEGYIAGDGGKVWRIGL